MSEFEEKEEVELWGFACKLTITEVNEFREYYRGTAEHEEMYGIQDVVDTYKRIGDVDKVRELNNRMRELDLIMFKMGKAWYQSHVENKIPDGL